VLLIIPLIVATSSEAALKRPPTKSTAPDGLRKTQPARSQSTSRAPLVAPTPALHDTKLRASSSAAAAKALANVVGDHTDSDSSHAESEVPGLGDGTSDEYVPGSPVEQEAVVSAPVPKKKSRKKTAQPV
jgi:hypothetical protein